MSDGYDWEKVKNAAAKDDVQHVIGYEKGANGLRISPSFAYTPEDVDRFIFSALCTPSLVSYVTLERKNPLKKSEEEENGRVGVVVRGCDSRAVIQILKEEGVSRDDLIIFGVPCNGVVDREKIKDLSLGPIEDMELKEEEENFLITVEQTEHVIPRSDILADKCLRCEYPNPLIYDELLAEEIENEGGEDYSRVKEIENMSLEDRWEYWKKEFDRCIRCYACREACPMCYCDECMADQLEPQWLFRSVDLSENAGWHLMRAFHLAGRCAGCGECERVCPMDIPLMELNKKLEKEVKELYDHKAGIDEEAEQVLAVFRPEDEEDFIL